MKIDLIGKSIDEVLTIVHESGGKEEHAYELLKGIYRRGLCSFEEVSRIPLKIRGKLKENYRIGLYPPVTKRNAADCTTKYLFENAEGQQFETVFMPSPKRNTLCISTQSGCRMGCKFCLTGKIEFKGNLSASDMLNQYLSIPERSLINRIVVMGMGEPFDNYVEIKRTISILTANLGAAFGASNITISTVGLHEQLAEFLKEPFCNLAVSLNNPFGNERQIIMPIEVSNPIVHTIELIKAHPLKKPLRVSFEYVALSGQNLTEKYALALASLLKGINCHLNVIPWNQHKDSQFITPAEIELNAFIDCLNRNGILTTIRQSRGQDIGAACGQMAGSKIIS